MAVEALYLHGDQSQVKRFNAAAALTPGEVLVAGNFVEIVVGSKPVAAGDDYTVARSGVWDLPALGTDTPAAGALMYWDATNNRLTTTSTGNKSAGPALEAKASGVTRMKIALNESVASITA